MQRCLEVAAAAHLSSSSQPPFVVGFYQLVALQSEHHCLLLTHSLVMAVVPHAPADCFHSCGGVLLLLQYGNGDFAPGIQYGPSGQYKCGHNLLLSHARAYRLYRSKYAATQKGKVGMALWSEWSEPWTNKPEGRWDSSRGGGRRQGRPAAAGAQWWSCC
jgi:hypothetical protein